MGETKNEMRTAAQIELLRAAREGDREAAGRVIELNQGLIWSIVRRFSSRLGDSHGADSDDLYQLGCLGMFKAAQSFSEEYGTQFSTYAVHKIAGEIRRFLRDDGMMKVSRNIKENAGRIFKTREMLQSSLGREPTLSEIAQELNLDPLDIAAADTAMLPVDSFQRETGEGGLELGGIISEPDGEDRIVNRLALEQVVQKLPDRERKVIELRFWRGQTQEQTSKVLGLSQVQISRIERKAIGMLREELLDEG